MRTSGLQQLRAYRVDQSGVTKLGFTVRLGTKSFALAFVIATHLSSVNQWVEAHLHGSNGFIDRSRLLKGGAALVAERGAVDRDVVVGA